MVRELRNYVNGAFVAAADGSTMESFNPATGKVHLTMPDSGAADMDAAVAAAKAAFPSWGGLSRAERAKWLNRIADKIEERLEDFAVAESQDQGKPVSLARAIDIPRAVYNFRYFAGAMLHHMERANLHEAAGAHSYSVRMPIGVAGLITPWNLPLYLLTWKVAPALVTGNTVVAKPSEVTSLTAHMLAEVMHELGLPAGVCNFVFGKGATAGGRLVEHPDVPLISFTGGTVTGTRISCLAAPQRKRLSLELGGKNPCIVFDDVDVAATAPLVARSSFANQGEICLCSSRIYVQEGIFDAFLAAFVAEAEKIKVGDPAAKDTNMGAIVSKEHLAKIRSYVRLAQEQGGKIECGDRGEDGAVVDGLAPELQGGYWMRPTVVTGLGDDSRCMREEIFGPVVGIVPFKDEAEVLARANDTNYGLSGSVWSKDGARAQRVAMHLQAGYVWVNCWLVRDLSMPFGGMKDSGTGREAGQESIDFYTEAKTICTKYQ